MKYKTISSIYQQEENIMHFKNCLFKLFQLSNETRKLTPLIGYSLLTLSFLQIVSLIKFHVINQEIDEFAQDYRIISVLLNYNIYLFRDICTPTIFSIFEWLIYAITLFILIMLIIGWVVVYLNNTSSNSLVFTILQYIFILVQWVIFVPFIQILAQGAYDMNSISRAIINSICIAFYFLITSFIAYFNIISSITPTDFFDTNDNKISLDHFCLQIISLIISIIIYHNDVYLFLGYIIIFLFLLKMSYDGLRRFLFYKRELALYFNVLIFLLYERLMNSVIIKYTTKTYGNAFHSYYIPSLIVLVGFHYFGNKLSLKYIGNYAIEHSGKVLKNVHEFVYFAESLFFIIKNEFSTTQIKKVGYIINHLNTCESNSCPLKLPELYLPKYCISSNPRLKVYADQVREAHLIMELYRRYYKAFRFDFDFVLCFLKFMLFSIGNYELLLIEIETATKYLKMTTYQEYILLLFKTYANEFIVKISENEVSKNVSDNQAYWSVLVLLNVLTYDKILRQIRHYIYLCLEKKRQLWRLIENEDIIIEDLFEIGNDFFTYKKLLNVMWEQLNSISDNNPDTEITNLYCDYLANICEDTIESVLIIEKVKYTLPQTPDEIFNNKFKSDTGVVIIKGNKEINLGKITYINESLTKILGYNQRSELLGGNIRAIIPGTIGKYHNTMLSNYFEKGYSHILKKTLGVCMKSKGKFLLPVHMLVSIIPNFKQQIQGIGLIRMKTNISETIICSEDGTIEGATLLISQLLNITPNFIEKNQYFIQGFFPQLMKPGKNGVPKLFTEEFKTPGKKTELKVELLSPEQNQIDNNKIKVKTKSSVLMCNSPKSKGSITKNCLTFGNKYNSNNKSISIDESPRKGKKHGNDEPTSPLSPIKQIRHIKSLSSFEKEQKDPIYSRSPVLKKKTIDILKTKLSPIVHLRRPSRSHTSRFVTMDHSFSNRLLPSHKQTPEINQILNYQRDFKSRTIKNITPNVMVKKMDNIYESMISLHSINTYNQVAEITINHICMDILGNPLHMITIPSESLFDIKKDDDDNLLSAFSNGGIENLRIPQGSKDKNEALALQDNEHEGSQRSRMDMQFEIDSLSSGKDSNLLLEKHLKEMKALTSDKYNTDIIIGVLMSLIMIIIAIVITVLSNELFSFSKKFIELTNQSFSIQYQLIDIAKFSTLISIQYKFDIDLESTAYYRDYKELLIKTAKSLLSEIETFLISYSNIFGYNFINEVYNTQIEFFFPNHKITLSFINAVYFMINNAISMNINSLISNMDNFIPVATQHWTVFIQNFSQKFTSQTNLLFRALYIFILVGLILIFILLLILFLSYKSKKTEQIGILSAYEKFVNDDVYHLLNKIEMFELRYIDLFKHDPEFKKKRVKFDTKNSNLLNKNNQARLIKKQEAQKSKYNILGMTDDLYEYADNGTNKELISRQNMTMKYIISVILIFSFCLLYSICLFAFGYYYYTMSKNYKDIATQLNLNKYQLNYESYKYDQSFLSNCIIINENRYSIEEVGQSLNYTHSVSNVFASLITSHLNLFNGNMTQIMIGNICEVLGAIKSCPLPEFNYTLTKGIRSFVSFFLKTLEEAYTYYEGKFTTIDSLAVIYTNEQSAMQRFLIEDVALVYDEIYYQMLYNLSTNLNTGLITIIISVVVLALLFLIAVTYRLRVFIDSIKQEEILCNRLIGEIPIDIVRGNNELKKCLNGHVKKE